MPVSCLCVRVFHFTFVVCLVIAGELWEVDELRAALPKWLAPYAEKLHELGVDDAEGDLQFVDGDLLAQLNMNPTQESKFRLLAAEQRAATAGDLMSYLMT